MGGRREVRTQRATMSKLDSAVSKDIENYDKSKLGKVEAKDGATPAQSRDMVMAGIEYHKGRDSMKKVETVEKNPLPTKEDIEKERKKDIQTEREKQRQRGREAERQRGREAERQRGR